MDSKNEAGQSVDGMVTQLKETSLKALEEAHGLNVAKDMPPDQGQSPPFVQ